MVGEAARLTDEGKLAPKVEVFDLNSMRDAFTAMANRKIKGKAVVRLVGLPQSKL